MLRGVPGEDEDCTGNVSRGSGDAFCLCASCRLRFIHAQLSKQWRPLSNLVGRPLQNFFALLDISADRDLFSKSCALANIDPMSVSIDRSDYEGAFRRRDDTRRRH